VLYGITDKGDEKYSIVDTLYGAKTFILRQNPEMKAVSGNLG